MRRIFLICGLLAAVGFVVAFVRAEDASGQLPARRVANSGHDRSSAQPSRLADRLKAIRESVTSEYAAPAQSGSSGSGANARLLAPPVEAAAPAHLPAETATLPAAANDPAPGLPSVLKRPGGIGPQVVESVPAPAHEALVPEVASAAPIAETIEPQPFVASPMAAEPNALREDQTEAGAMPTAEMPTPADSFSPQQVVGLPQPAPAYVAALPSIPTHEAAPSPRPAERSPSDISAAPAERSVGATGSLLEGQLPSLRLETVGPSTITVGKPASYRVRVQNTSALAAHDVFIKVIMPANVRSLGGDATSGTAQMKTLPAGSYMGWSLPELRPQSDEELELIITAQDNRLLKLDFEWTLKPASSTAHIEVLQPKLQMTVSGPPEIIFGAAADYTIVVQNPGTGVAENVVLTLASGQQEGESKQLGTIEPGGRREISLQLAARQAGKLSLHAVASADGGIKTEASEEILVRRANLKIVAAGPRTQYYAGDNADFQLEVENSGDADAQDVVVNVVLPPGAKALSQATSASAGTLQWPVGTLRAGEKRTIEFRCEMMIPGDNRIEFHAQAPGGLTATEKLTTYVEALADLKMIVNDPKGPVSTGENVEYEVLITNRGTKAAHHVTILAQFSTGIEPIASEGSPAEIVPGQVMFHPLDHLQAGETKALKITARAEEDGAHRFRVEVKCIDPETRLVAEETTRYVRHRKE